jgi:hypothetical protein
MNNNKTQQNTIEKNVLEKIQSGEVKMRSKTYFVLKVALLVIVALLVLVTSALLVSFMIFSLRVSGRLFLLGFGERGLMAFFVTFPWFILIADILFVILFERLLNHFKFAYRTPLVYTIGASALIIILAGFGLDRISFHETLFQEAAEHHLGPVGGLYTDIRLPPRQEGVFRGIVTSVATNISAMPPGWPAYNMGTSSMVSTNSAGPFINAFTMRRYDEDVDTDSATDTAMTWYVILPTGVSVAGFVKPGDVVLVAGDVLAASGTASGTVGGNSNGTSTGSGTIRAYGIREISAGDEQ